MARSAPVWPGVLHYGQECSIMARSAPLWPGVLHYGQECSIMAAPDLLCAHEQPGRDFVVLLRPHTHTAVCVCGVLAH